MSLAATAQLVERLRAQTEATQGDLYGLIPECGKPSAVALALLVVGEGQGDMGHPPALLLPPPMTRLGVFKVTEGDRSCPDLEDGEVGVVWDQREVVWYSGPGSEGTALQVLAATQLHALFAVAKVTFSLELWCRQSARDSSRDPTPTPGPPGTKGNAAALCEELDSAAACFRVRGGRLLLHGGSGGVLCGGGAALGAGDAAGGVLFKAAGGKKKAGGGGGGGQQEATFQLVFNRSAAVVEGPAAAPVVRVDNCEAAVVCAAVAGEAVAYLDKGAGLGQLAGVLAGAVAGQVRLAEHWLALQRSRPELRGPLTALAALPHAAGHLVGLVYPAGGRRRPCGRTGRPCTAPCCSPWTAPWCAAPTPSPPRPAPAPPPWPAPTPPCPRPAWGRPAWCGGPTHTTTTCRARWRTRGGGAPTGPCRPSCRGTRCRATPAAPCPRTATSSSAWWTSGTSRTTSWGPGSGSAPRRLASCWRPCTAFALGSCACPAARSWPPAAASWPSTLPRRARPSWWAAECWPTPSWAWTGTRRPRTLPSWC
ncbi:uncharacterized protein LOC135096572 [Scylla paramamosain]|uniref:uncharacterized protein LOC135096572 n=1 Tax=Scylla paramamosain TaxID=85552 RepID=UPI0030836B20